MSAQNAELSRRIFEDVWNRKNLSAVDEIISADYVHHDANSPAASGIDGYKQFVNYYMNAFPDAHFTIDDAFTDGENEVTRWTVTGTHEGELAGIPRTGRRFSVTGISI
ncbi:MAG: ester cyclase, partial [Acidobacteria bacterium]